MSILNKKYSLPPPKKILKILIISLFIIMFFMKIENTYSFRRFRTHQSFNGDEPKYMRMVHSLVKDGSLDLSNIWGSKEEMDKVKKEIIASGSKRFGDMYIIGVNGSIYPMHMPGLALLLSPGYLLDSILYPNVPGKAPTNLPFLPLSLYFTRLSLIAISILTLLLLFRLLYHHFQNLFFVSVLLLLFLLNSPFSGYSSQVYPSIPATLFSLLALNSILYPFKNKGLNDFFIIVGIGFLPWFHQRFIFLSLGLFLGFLIVRKNARIPLKRVFVISIILMILSLSYFYYFYFITGNPSPLSISKLFGKVYARANILPLGFFGNFFSRTASIIWTYPWIILFFFGIYWGVKKNWRLTAVLLVISIPYYLICSAAVSWDGVARPVGRYLIPLFPVFLIFAGKTIQDIFEKFSYPKLFFYIGYVLLIFLNKKIWFINFNFSYSYIEHADLILIIKSTLIIFSLYISIFFGDKFLFQRNSRELANSE